MYSRIAFFTMLAVLGIQNVNAQIHPLVVCSVTGTSPVTTGYTYTYSLNGACSADHWTCSCGTIQDYSPTSVTIYFNVLTCGTATIAAKSATNGTLASKTVTVNQPPPLDGGTISDPSQVINYNTAPGEIDASLATGGGCGGSYTYQWYFSTDGTNFSSISGATNQNYQPGSLTATTWFKRWTGCSGTAVYSDNVAQVMVYPPVGGGNAGPAQSINYNTAPSQLSLSNVSGGNGTYSYQWQSSTDNSSWSNISGATSATYTPGALTGNMYYRATVTSNGVFANSASVLISVYPQLVSGSVFPSNGAINYNTVPSGGLSVSGTSGGNGVYTYQWQSCSTMNGTYTPITGATGDSYMPGPLTATTYFEVITYSNGASVTSSPSTITVYPQLLAGSVSPLPETINYGRDPGQLSLTSVTGGTGYYNYVWQTSPDNVNWTDAGASYPWSPGPLISSTYFRAKVSSNGAIAYSSSGLVTVNPQLFPGSISPSSVTITTGGSPGTLTGNPASGGTCGGNFTYQWLQSADGNTFTPISGATGQNYSPGTLSANTWFQREVVCGSDVEYTNVSVVSIGSAGSPDTMNFIRERAVTRPGILDTVSADQLTDPNDVKQVTTYYDGLGRPIQSVARQASPHGNDLVTPIVYDAMGRQQTKYLPYVSASTDGEYKFDALAEQNSFNAAQFPGESFYYGQVNYEPSPLNRVQASFAPGTSWVGNSRGITSQYLLNTDADSVRIWAIASTPGSIPTSPGVYPAGQLDKRVTTDEQNRTVIVYTDNRGKTILKKAQLSSSPSSGHYGWVCTYYVYDTLLNLRYILQPNVVNAIIGSWIISPQMSQEGCFRYEYDARRRTIVKNVPGSGEFWSVYDARDRLVMSQDSNQRKRQIWLVTKYDSLNRPYVTGLLTDAHDRIYHQGLAGSSISYPNTASNFEVLTQTFFDDYSWVIGTGSSLPASMATNNTGNSKYFITTYNTSPSYAVPVTPFGITRSMVTGTAKKVMGSVSQYLYAESFYDDHSRIVQTQSINVTGGIDTVTTQYDYSGKPLRSLLNHN